jgi:hypothetical protein
MIREFIGGTMKANIMIREYINTCSDWLEG